jgi:uncharacterized protein YlzI (FlbEa/FlbD family)
VGNTSEFKRNLKSNSVEKIKETIKPFEDTVEHFMEGEKLVLAFLKPNYNDKARVVLNEDRFMLKIADQPIDSEKVEEIHNQMLEYKSLVDSLN